MKISALGLAIFAISSPLIAEESRQWEFLLGGDVGTYDRSDYDYIGWSCGIGYKTDCGTHLLVIGVGELNNSKRGSILYPDIDSFSVAYRYSYTASERFNLFAEIGAERLSWSETISDALGSPLSVGFDDTFYFLGLGAEVKLLEHLYLTGSVRYYLSGNDVFESSSLGIDGLGNTVVVKQEAPDLIAKIGLTFKF